MKKMVITVIALLAVYAGFFISDLIREQSGPGSIEISIVDENGTTISTGTYTYEEDDTLLEILVEYYDVRCADNNYNPTTCENSSLFGHVILEIDDVSTDWTNNYIAIYINDVYSTYGIDDIVLEDGYHYTFTFTEVGDNE
jgi:hypothetical protein